MITFARAQQVTCPQPVSYPIKASGTDAKFQSSSVLGIWNPTVSTAGSQSTVLANAESQCTSDLTTKIAQAVKKCFLYCTTIPQCSPQTTPPSINTCIGDEITDCHVENRPVHGMLYNPRYGYYPIPISANFPAWVCTVKKQTSLGCECV